jgi:MFS family permease
MDPPSSLAQQHFTPTGTAPQDDRLLAGGGPPRDSRRSARLTLAVLTLVNFLNYLDRFVISALVESLKASPLAPDDAQIGFLATAFILVYTLASPLFGTLGDRRSRPKLIALGVALWSAATAMGGAATTYGHLLAARAAVGIGEAAYATIAPALLADYFPKRERGRVFAIFYSAIPIGSAAGYIVGGFIDERYGWRAAFLVAGLPGLLLSLVCLLLGDPPRGAQDSDDPHVLAGRPAPAVAAVYRGLVRNVPYRLTVAGYAAYTFGLGALAFWMPAFLERTRGMSQSEATVQFGSIVVATGLVGTFAGGWIADAWLSRTRAAYLWVSGWATLAAAPAVLVAITAASWPVYMTAIVVAELLLFASTGPINSAIVGAVAPNERATAVSVSILAIHLLGDVPSPPLIGAISDATSLEAAFLLVPVAIAIGGLVWLYAARRWTE